MPMRVEEEADWLIRGLVNEPDDFPRRPREVGINHQHVVFENNPGAIGRLLEPSLPEVDAWRQFADGGFLAACSHKYECGKHRHEREASPCMPGSRLHSPQKDSRIERSRRRL